MSDNSKCWWRCGEIWIVLHFWQKCKVVHLLWKTVWLFSIVLRDSLLRCQISVKLSIISIRTLQMPCVYYWLAFSSPLLRSQYITMRSVLFWGGSSPVGRSPLFVFSEHNCLVSRGWRMMLWQSKDKNNFFLKSCFPLKQIKNVEGIWDWF